MSDDKQQSIVDRVAKMLRLANDAGATEGERDNALRMAQKTMAKYNLDMAAVEGSLTKGSQAKGTPGEERIREYRRYFGRAPWAREVSNASAQLLFCYYVYAPHSGDRTNVEHIFIGRRSNAVTASLLGEYLVKSIQAEGRARYGGDRDGLRGFCQGAANALWYRVQALIKEAKNEEPQVQASNGMALTLRSVYESEIEANKQLVGKTREVAARETKRVSHESFRAGAEYGKQVSLARQVK